MHPGLGLKEFSLKKATLSPTLVKSFVTPRAGTLPMTNNSMPSFGHLSIRVST